MRTKEEFLNQLASLPELDESNPFINHTDEQLRQAIEVCKQNINRTTKPVIIRANALMQEDAEQVLKYRAAAQNRATLSAYFDNL